MDLRVLVVCPDQESAKLLSLVLGEMEMTAEHAPSISRGLERLNDENFEAVILDYRADLDSEEFLSKLRQTRKSLHTLLIAIVDGEFSARPLFGLGANFVLYRPLSLERTRLSLRAARALMRRERRRAPRIPVNSSASVAYPGTEDLRAGVRGAQTIFIAVGTPTAAGQARADLGALPPTRGEQTRREWRRGGASG